MYNVSLVEKKDNKLLHHLQKRLLFTSYGRWSQSTQIFLHEHSIFFAVSQKGAKKAFFAFKK